jgi:hypothetical protein
VKTKKSSPAKRARAIRSTHKKRAVRARPFHKRVLLHPFSVMVLLCAGVLIIGSTFRGYAADMEVTGIVPAPLPTDPAVITDPVDEQHFSAQPIMVSGTCPEDSFVKLYRNGTFSGVAQCTVDLTFQIETNLSIGANELDPKVFNFTGQEGPAGTPITVYYDELITPPPVTPVSEELPAQLIIETVELYDFTKGEIAPTSINPTITGFAPPYSDVTVTFHSEVSHCRTKADGNGFWSCTLNHMLDIGLHKVDVVAVDQNGKRFVFPTFTIRVIRGMASLKKPAPVNPFAITGEYLYTTKRVNQSFSFSLGVQGGTAPYQLTVDWGDGNETGLMHYDQSTFTIAHTYKKPGQYVVLVRGTDAGKQSALLQLSAVVTGSADPAGGGGWISGTISGVRQWLWLVWPVYIAVLLMVLSYWIGEQEAYQRLVTRRRLVHTGGRGKSR